MSTFDFSTLPRPSVRHMATWIASRAAVAAAVLVAAELVLRIPGAYKNPWQVPEPRNVNPYTTNEFLVHSLPFIHFHLPNARYTQVRMDMRAEYRMNSLGFRGPEFAAEPPAGMRRLALLGDSVVEGAFVAPEQTFASIVGERLHPDGWEVLNLGIQGSSPMHMAANWERYMHLNPDAVLLYLHDNDMSDDFGQEFHWDTHPAFEYVERLPEGRVPTDGPPIILEALARRAFNGMFARRLGGLADDVLDRREAAGQLDKKRDHGVGACVARADRESCWNRTSAYLDAIRDECDRRGIMLLVTHGSLEFLITDDMPACPETAHYYQQQLALWSADNGVPFLHLNSLMADDFAVRPRPTVLLAHDSHPSPEGHLAIAGHLEKWLREELPAAER